MKHEQITTRQASRADDEMNATTIESLDAISRTRALTDAESLQLEGAGCNRVPKRKPIDQPSHYARFDPVTDAAILTAAGENVPAKAIARQHGRTPWSIYTRLRDLRKASGVQMRAGGKRIRAREKEQV